MAKKRGSRIRTALLLVLAVAALWWWIDRAMSVRLVPADAAPPASPLALVDLDGGELSLSGYRGRVVLLNLWAGWCRPCRTEIPRLARLDRELRSEGLTVLGLNVESLPPAALGPLARELGIGYPVLLPGGGFHGTFATDGSIPQTWLIDRRGRVRSSHTGLATERSLRRACLELLAEGS